MAEPDDDGEEVDLGISLEIVATVVDLANAVQEAEEAKIGDDDDDEPEDDDEEDEISEEMLTDYIDELNEEQQVALIALAWVGRGDYEPEEWAEAVKLATERNVKGDASSLPLRAGRAGRPALRGRGRLRPRDRRGGSLRCGGAPGAPRQARLSSSEVALRASLLNTARGMRSWTSARVSHRIMLSNNRLKLFQ
jgi:hypothetical protein